jgi:hypothetical protein
MLIRWTLPNGTYIWHRADQINSVQKHGENLVRTIVCTTVFDPRKGMLIYEAIEDTSDIAEAICVALKTGMPQVVRSAPDESPGHRLVS